jgi:hypothetical protein
VCEFFLYYYFHDFFFSTVTEWQKLRIGNRRFFFWSSQKSQIFFSSFYSHANFQNLPSYFFVCNVEEGCDTTEWNIFFCVHIILKWKSLKMLKFFTLCGRKWKTLSILLRWCCVMLWDEFETERFSFIESRLLIKSFSSAIYEKLLNI